MTDQTLAVQKSEILFLYESRYNTPNGDPFTGEQRYDDETKKILVSDVRIKRYIRDYLMDTTDQDVYVLSDISQVQKEKMSGAAARMKALKSKYKDLKEAVEVMKKCIDVRLFGGISTEGGAAVNLTGPVQFGLLNASLNAVNLRIHQNTSVFSSNVAEKSRGAIGTTSVVPYALNQIHGWINPYSAVHTDLSQKDINLMFEALWNSVNNINTRSKANQDSVLLLQIIYADPNKKLYGLDRMIKLRSDKKEEEIRSRDDYELDLSALFEARRENYISKFNFYTDDVKLKNELKNKKKFNEVTKLWKVS